MDLYSGGYSAKWNFASPLRLHIKYITSKKTQPQNPAVRVGLPFPPKERNKMKEQRKRNILSAPRRGLILLPSPRRRLELLFHLHLDPRPVARASEGVSSGIGDAAAPRTLRGSEGDLTPNSRPHDLTLVPARCKRGFAWCPPIWCGVGRDVIAVRPNNFLRVIGLGAAVLRCCFQPLGTFSPPSGKLLGRS